MSFFISSFKSFDVNFYKFNRHHRMCHTLKMKEESNGHWGASILCQHSTKKWTWLPQWGHFWRSLTTSFLWIIVILFADIFTDTPPFIVVLNICSFALMLWDWLCMLLRCWNMKEYFRKCSLWDYTCILRSHFLNWEI